MIIILNSATRSMIELIAKHLFHIIGTETIISFPQHLVLYQADFPEKL